MIIIILAQGTSGFVGAFDLNRIFKNFNENRIPFLILLIIYQQIIITFKQYINLLQKVVFYNIITLKLVLN